MSIWALHDFDDKLKGKGAINITKQIHDLTRLEDDATRGNRKGYGIFWVVNEMKDEILCVRGNCEAEVDQMVLEFPVLADYCILYEAGHMIFATHGHKYNMENLPPLKKGDILQFGKREFRLSSHNLSSPIVLR